MIVPWGWVAVRYAAAIGAGWYLINQVRKPARWVGRPFLWMMNASHSGLTDWGLRHVQINKNSRILDVGCGGGRTIEKLAALASGGTVDGIDYAEGSVAESRARNARLIAAGRVGVQMAAVSRLPFEENTYDLVTAVETQYYWPDLPGDMREILRVLKPGGTLIVVAESYGGGSNELLQRPVMKLLKSAILSVEDQRKLFAGAGYCDVEIFEERSHGWICVAGKKGAAS